MKNIDERVKVMIDIVHATTTTITDIALFSSIVGRIIRVFLSREKQNIKENINIDKKCAH